MLPATDEEAADVTAYYLSQSPGAQVNFLQKIYAETIFGHRHEVWDIHASDGRWWVITNPTNLYSQDQFPNMDLAVTFHMGLCLRIPRSQRQRADHRNIQPFKMVLAKMQEVDDALDQAQNVADYQAIGMRCREALLAFVGAAQDYVEWPADSPPKRADFRAWAELICNTALSGDRHKERRHLFKSSLSEAWMFSNWLTHAHSATWHDAEAAQATISHILGLAISLIIRFARAVPEQCPECGSPHLAPQEGYLEEQPDIAWERPICGDCGWAGKPIPVGEREFDDDEIFVREGDVNDEHVIPNVPLIGLKRPGSP